ncbi:MAG TPA: DUF2171 domain-containing protein [Ktedonobacteraceae bacterium]|nr:DUF2171 domain-containing protein [Ktedonobacteraceae bacterium]
MASWNQQDLRTNMKVYSADAEHLGHVAEAYEDSFLLHKGYFLPIDRYIPYSAIASVDENSLKLTLSASGVQDKEWKKRPDYELHRGDPTQLMYDRGHGVRDPYDEGPNP